MIGLIQRVTAASVVVAGEAVGEIGDGILALVAVEQDDTQAEAARLLDRLLGYRVFADDGGRMNLSLSDTGGGLLLVPQFTLAADTHKGMRASFGPAAPPDEGHALFDHLVGLARKRHPIVATGAFGEHMKVCLENDGPVTFWLQAKPRPAAGRRRDRQ
jgi:D-tyrosyl-tRNA(Tyr) deacylase